jgi:hypothetical protein
MSGLDVPLSLLNSDIATAEAQIAWSLSFPIEDYDAIDAVVDARTQGESRVPSITESHWDAWDAGVVTVAEWLRDIRYREAPLVDAQLALLAVHSSEACADPELRAEIEELEAFIDEVRLTVPGPAATASLKVLRAEIVIRQLADSEFDVEAALKDLLVRAAASDMSARERIVFLAEVEELLVELHFDAAELGKAGVIADRLIARVLEYRDSGEIDADVLDEVILRVMERRIAIAQDQGDLDALVEVCSQFFEWLHLESELGGYGGSDQERLASRIVVLVQEFRDELNNVPGFWELYESVRSVYSENAVGDD